MFGEKGGHSDGEGVVWLVLWKLGFHRAFVGGCKGSWGERCLFALMPLHDLDGANHGGLSRYDFSVVSSRRKHKYGGVSRGVSLYNPRATSDEIFSALIHHRTIKTI